MNRLLLVLEGGITEDLGKALCNEISRISMRKFLHHKNVLSSTLFDLIHWEPIENAMENVSHSFQLWATKHISGFSSVNRRRFICKEIASPNCPICKQPGMVEMTRNQLVCTHETRTKLWRDSTLKLQIWLVKYDTHPEITELIVEYVQGWVSIKAVVLSPRIGWNDLTIFIDAIDWFITTKLEILSSLSRLGDHSYSTGFYASSENSGCIEMR